MKNLKFMLVACLVALAMGSCKEDDSHSVTFEKRAYYFKWGGEPQSAEYVSVNVASITAKSVTEGWTCVVDHAARKVTVTPPKDPVDEAQRDKVRNGSAVMNVIAENGEASKYTLNFYIVGDQSFHLNPNGEYANCYIVSEPTALYSLDVSANGAGEKLSDVADVKLLWQSNSALLQHVDYDDLQTASFFIDCKKDDKGNVVLENGKHVLVEGNAVIAAYDSKGEIVWSWHIWVVSKDVCGEYDTYANGRKFMQVNLGAFDNSNGANDNAKIHASYGLYYQWGRKDPFLRPKAYNCADGSDETVFNASNSAEYVKTEETSETVGTIEYAVKHPTTMIINPACVGEKGDGIGDWLHNPNSNLWSNAKKSVYDPCPYGWRVPAKTDFDVLSLTAEEDGMDIDVARKRFGWSLSDGQNSYFYLGGGFRSYFDGVIANMNYKTDVFPSTPEPWEGYYWTSGTTSDGKYATCMYFDLTTTRTINKFNLNYPSRRANAMQVRCVKVE
jgi:uncharacterized protein (TIGR02145 family)